MQKVHGSPILYESHVGTGKVTRWGRIYSKTNGKCYPPGTIYK